MRRILIAVLAATALAATFQTASAEALGPSRCYQWDIGQARFNQSNGWVVQFDFRHGGYRTFGGQARTWDNRGNFGGFGTVQGVDDRRRPQLLDSLEQRRDRDLLLPPESLRPGVRHHVGHVPPVVAGDVVDGQQRTCLRWA